MIHQNEMLESQISTVNLANDNLPVTELLSCERCHGELKHATTSKLCDSCEKVIQVLKQVMPQKRQQISKKKIICPDCHGDKGQYMNPPNSCCGQGCCYVTCKTCSGTGKIRVL
ncbi:MAG: hypothetical protein HQL69_08290 [Magnetococcales bacterium]|nr:hypothetical protein [Magnetococcales bacterium]